jgi:DNA-binding HxlR family transcriptional regulator
MGTVSAAATPGLTPDAAAGEHPPAGCDGALRRAFSFLGKRWNGVVLGTLTNGPAGFRELSRGVDGISDSVLSDRLTELAAAGLVRRTVDEGPPVAVSYALTPAGQALVPALEELARWAGEHLPAERCPGA